jgi:hypothetical protein
MCRIGKVFWRVSERRTILQLARIENVSWFAQALVVQGIRCGPTCCMRCEAMLNRVINLADFANFTH